MAITISGPNRFNECDSCQPRAEFADRLQGDPRPYGLDGSLAILAIISCAELTANGQPIYLDMSGIVFSGMGTGKSTSRTVGRVQCPGKTAALARERR